MEDGKEARKIIALIKKGIRMMLGKERPPFFLLLLCWMYLVWSFLMALVMLGLIVASGLKNALFTPLLDEQLSSQGPKFFLVYFMLHLMAGFGVVLMYRKKLIGFYVFSLPTLIMPFMPVIKGSRAFFDLNALLFSIVSVGLFSLYYNLFKRAQNNNLQSID